LRAENKTHFFLKTLFAAFSIYLLYEFPAGYSCRMTWLRENSVPSDIERFWLRHANKTVGDDYSMLKRNMKFRKQIAEKISVGFELPDSIWAPVVPNAPKMTVAPPAQRVA
jgi:hypothetical protein